MTLLSMIVRRTGGLLSFALAVACGLWLALPSRAMAQEQDEGGSEGLPAGLTMPQSIEQVSPEFPSDAIADGVEADVIMSIVIGADGAIGEVTPEGLVYFTYDSEGYLVEEPRALESDPYGFVPAAVEAIRQFQFAPASLLSEETGEAVPVAVTLTWRMSFVYEEVEAPTDVASEGSGAAAAS